MKKTMAELRAMLEQRGLENKGESKQVLVDRLPAAPAWCRHHRLSAGGHTAK